MTRVVGRHLRFACKENLVISDLRRWLVVPLALIVFGIQSLVIQPHVHLQPADFGVASVTVDGPLASGEERPSDDPFSPDLNDCHVCQSAHQNGQYLKPTATIYTLVPSVNHRTIDLVRLPQSPQALSHSWQGRAPPQA